MEIPMDSGKFIMTVTGWTLTILGLAGALAALGLSIYHTFWMPADYQISSNGSFTSLSYASISPLLIGLFPLVLSLLLASIGQLFLKQARKRELSSVG